MSLINKIFDATANGTLAEPFTVDQMKAWITRECIRKDNGKKYAESSINAILSNSNLKNRPTSNKNRKVLLARKNLIQKNEYWFQS